MTFHTEKFETIKNAVTEVLESDQGARDNDTWLIVQVLRKLGFKIYIDYSEIHKLPSFETITRIRRSIQNKEHKFEPSESIRNARQSQVSEGLLANNQLDY